MQMQADGKAFCEPTKTWHTGGRRQGAGGPPDGSTAPGKLGQGLVVVKAVPAQPWAPWQQGLRPDRAQARNHPAIERHHAALPLALCSSADSRVTGGRRAAPGPRQWTPRAEWGSHQGEGPSAGWGRFGRGSARAGGAEAGSLGELGRPWARGRRQGRPPARRG